MSSMLYRLGRTVARRWRAVLLAWLAVVVVAGVAAVAAGGRLTDSFTIPGTEAQRGIDALHQRFPELAGASAQVLFVAPDGAQVADYAEDIADVLAEAETAPDVVYVSDPFAVASALSADGRHAISQIQLSSTISDLDPATAETLVAIADAATAATDLDVHAGGSIFGTRSVHLGPTEMVGVLLALVILAVTFSSMVAAGLPILTAVVGVGVGMAGILVAAAVTDISTTTPTLALMIGLAVGIDYALFVLSRHRAQLARGMDVGESIAESVATAGSAVIFAGTTVMIALIGLLVARVPFLGVMGVAAAATVAVAVVVAVTALPALMAALGERLRPRPGSRAARHATVRAAEGTTMGARWVAVVTRAPIVTIAVVVLGLLAAAVPAKDLALSLPDNGIAEEGSPERITYDLISEAYGPGFNTPLLVTADIIATTDPLGVMAALGEDLGAFDGVAAVAIATPNATADLGIVQIIPEHSQTDERTVALVQAIRADRDVLEERHGVSDLIVTGQSAAAIDISERLTAALLPFGIVVVGLSLVLLTVVFRSIAVPVKATIGYLFSVLAAFGAIAAVFQWGWFADALNVTKTGPVISFLPIMLMGVLFGLAMDYEVFLVSRMREDWVHTGDAQRAVRSGFAASARVVTAAALIMISVFAAFIPEADPMVKPVALGLAVGVVVDAFVVRMTLVPAVLAVLGERAWWLPEWLDRRLPSIDIEGAALEHHLEHEAWLAEHGPAAVRAEGVGIPDDAGDRGADVGPGWLVADASLVVRPGEIVAVRSDDAVARAAFLAAVAGRLRTAAGRLVVLDRVLPDEAGAVRSRVPFLLDPGPDGGAIPDAPLVVADLAGRAAAWPAVLAAAGRGGAAVVGVSGVDRLPVGVTAHDLRGAPGAPYPSPPAPGEVTLDELLEVAP